MKNKITLLCILIVLTSVSFLFPDQASGQGQNYHTYNMEWTPDGKSVVFIARWPECWGGSRCEEYVAMATVNPKGQIAKTARLLNIHTKNYPYVFRALAWTSTGKLAFAGTDEKNKDGNIYIPNLIHPSEAHIQLTSEVNIQDFSWSPDGKSLAYIGSDPNTWTLWLSTAGNPAVALQTGVESFAWSPDNKHLVYLKHTYDNRFKSEFRCDMVIAEAQNPGSMQTVYTYECDGWESPQGIHWSPDGKSIAFVNEDYKIYILDIDGTNLRMLTKNTDDMYQSHPRWSPDGSKISYTSYGKVYIWNIKTDKTEVLQFTLRR